MQNSLINLALLVCTREGQGFNYFPEGEKVKWPNNGGTPKNLRKVKLENFQDENFQDV